MTERERFLATMHYQPRDRSPICDFGFWPETIEVWHEQGLPKWVGGGHETTSTDKFFGMDSYWGGPGISSGLTPGFEQKVIEDRGDHALVQQGDGVIVLQKKFMGSIPQHHGHLLVDRESWNKHYKWRLDPANPERHTRDLVKEGKQWDRKLCSVAGTGSLYGWLRNWMGVENLSLVVYDDPAWFEEMVVTITDLQVAMLQDAYAHGLHFDMAAFWEDMCYCGGPLLSPEHFKRFLVPQYKRITELMRSHGTDIFWVDCDGKVDDLIPLWLEAGVNCMFPIEVGVWGGDAVAYRRQYGRELLLMGGFDKHILQRGPRAIETEAMRLAPLVEEGGFIGFADHRVPPDVPLENYMFYLQTVRREWGHNINLKPLGELQLSEVLI
ncbi:MAG TPA: uroporphyrinogen decarboxylase family protein [Tepidisphaeraceae bacterium]|jgi:uroporphyrinogen decarboxylase